MGKQPIGAAIVSPFIIRVAALLLSFSATAVGQERTYPTAITIVPNTITSIPPLARAVMSGDRERVSKVLAETKDVNDPVRAKEGARAGFTPLILAVALSESDIAHLLIDRGADVTILDDYRRSALWYAAVQQNTDIAATLVDKAGTNKIVNVADTDLGRTPLQIAVRGTAPQLVSLLLKAGASKDQKDVLGETAVDYCRRDLTTACKELPLN